MTTTAVVGRSSSHHARHSVNECSPRTDPRGGASQLPQKEASSRPAIGARRPHRTRLDPRSRTRALRAIRKDIAHQAYLDGLRARTYEYARALDRGESVSRKKIDGLFRELKAQRPHLHCEVRGWQDASVRALVHAVITSRRVEVGAEYLDDATSARLGDLG